MLLVIQTFTSAYVNKSKANVHAQPSRSIFGQYNHVP